MSKTVDERVVEMRFDNKQFEANVQTSMSTLDKLKQKLNLSDSAKSLEKVEDASRKINMSGLSGAVETVSAKFSALQVVGITALANITNSAVNAGKRIVSALTIDPVKTGFNEYELKMDSVKTIIASTGEPIEKVNSLLNELNKYSDETIYSFADMTQNIGKFTNAGVKLEDAVMAIKGISNEAAVSGANANEASRAMYNFAQALSAGHVKLIDWKSIELANMATKEFKEQLINAAVSAGTLTKTADGMYKTMSGNTLTATRNFNETLQDQWMTTDVLINTLKDYADETTEIGAKAKSAAQDVTKFSQIFDILKETAQSGWAATWELIFGDINQAKKIFTPLTEFLSDIINKMSDFRNNLLEGALGSPLGKLVDKISNVTAVTGTAVEKMQDYSDIVNRVINGEFGNTEQRWNKLTEMGYNWAHVQNLVNEKLGNSYRRTVDLTDAQGEQTKQTIELTDAKLRELGLTDDEIKQYRDLEKAAKAAGMTIDEYIASMNKKTGRELLIEAITNAGKGLVKVFSAIKNAWTEIFPPATSQQLYNIIEGINKFSKKLVMSDETADKVKRTFKGLFAILDMVRTILGGAFSIAFKVAKSILGAFGLDILDVTAYIGDAIVKIRDWIKEHDLIGKAISTVVPFIANIISKIVEWVKSTELLQNGLTGLKSGLSSAWKATSQWFAGLKEADNIPKYIFEGLVNGLKSGISKVVETVGPLAQKIIDVVKKVLGIASPSKVFFAIGGFIIAGLIGGIKAFLPGLWDTLSGFVSNITGFFKDINWGTIFAVGMSAGSILVVNKIATGIKGIGEMFAGAGEVMSKAAKPIKKILNNTAKVVNSFSKVLNGVSWKLKAEAFKAIAVSIAIVVAAIIAMTFVDTDKLWNSVKVIGALAIIMMLLIASVNSMAGGSKDLKSGAVNIAKIGGMLLSIGAAILLIAIAMKILGKLSPAQYEQGIIAIGVILIGMAGLIKVLGKTSSTADADKQIESLGKTMRKLAVSLLIMVVVIKLLGMMDTGALIQGGAAVVALGLIITGLMRAVKKYGSDQKVGATLMSVAGAIAILALIVIILGKAEIGTLIKGAGAVIVLGLIITGLMRAVKKYGSDQKVGATLMSVAGAIAILAIVAIILGMVDVGTLLKGVGAVMALGIIIKGLMRAVKKYGKDAKDIGKTMLMIAGAIAILAIAAVILGILDITTLAKGVAAVSILAIMMSILIKATKNAEKAVGTIVALTVVIAVLAAAVIILSQMDPVGVAVGAAAMSGVMAVMALVLKTAKSAEKAIGTIIAITAVIALIAVALYILAGLPVDGLIAAGSALAGVLLSLSVSLILINKLGTLSKKGMLSLAIMTAVIAVLGVVLYKLAELPAENVMSAAIALSTVLGAFTVSLAILALIGMAGPAAFVGIGALATLIVGMGAIVVAIGALMSKIPALEEFLDKGIVVLEKIGEAIGRFLGGIIDGFLTVATANLPEVADKLSEFAVKLIPFITVMGAVNARVIEGAGILAGAIIALTVAELINGIASLFGIGLPELGTTLSDFADNSQDFITTMKKIDPDVADASKALAETILVLTAANLLNGISNFLGFGTNSIEKFGKQLPKFGEGLNEFALSVDDVDGAQVKVAADAGKTLANMADQIPRTGGLVGLFAGDNDFGEFADNIGSFGEGLKTLYESTTGMNIDTVKTAAEAGKTLSNMAKEIPKTGGLISLFTGDNDFGEFSDNIAKFGKALWNFDHNIVGIKPERVSEAAKASKILVEMANGIPNTGGFFSLFTGDNNLSTIGDELAGFGKALWNFDHNIVGIKPERVSEAAKASKILVEMANGIENSGGFISLFTGNNNLSTIGDELADFGTALLNFSNNLTGIKSTDGETFWLDNVGDFDPEKVKNAAAAAGALIEVANNVENTGGLASWFSGENNIAAFGKELAEFGNQLKNFSNNLGNNFDQEKVQAAANAGATIASIGDSKYNFYALENLYYYVTEYFIPMVGALRDGITNINVTGLKVEVEKVKEIADLLKDTVFPVMSDLTIGIGGNQIEVVKSFESVLDSLLKPIDYDKYSKGFQEVGTKIAGHISTGMTAAIAPSSTNSMAGGSVFNIAAKAIRDSVVNSVYLSESNFEEPGLNCVNGFADGIKGNLNISNSAAYEMGTQALLSLRLSIRSNSPSKEFETIGTYAPMGFANGIDKLTYLASDASKNMASTAMNSTRKALSRIANVVNSDIDSRPTIRPVLDLSDVANGAGAINRMLSMSPSVGLMSSTGSIMYSMNKRQNGTTSDVISAINSLGKSLASSNGDTYNINGITYDDGSNVSDAIKTLIRAARIERRT